jgi:hypothetical protein
MRFRRFSAITTPSLIGSEPPLRLVPLPRATNGTPKRWQAFTAAMTSSCVTGDHYSEGALLEGG